MTDADSETGARAAEASPKAAPAEKASRGLPVSTKRILLILAGLLVLGGSVYGFYATSDAFDERVPVLVAARRIEVGETVSAADLTSDRVLAGSIPHVAWSPDVPFVFDGMVAAQPIPAGAVVLGEMFVEAETTAVGVELELDVPLDLIMATDAVSEGDPVLLVDPGAEPVPGDEGRPRRVVRPPGQEAHQFELTNFDGTRMQLFLSPEDWADWEELVEDAGGTLMVIDLGIGADGDETTQRLNAVWSEQWEEAVSELAAALADLAPAAGPGELEIIVALDDGLVPSGVSEGDTVLLVDPGREPEGNDPGRPMSVIGLLDLDNYLDGVMQMFVPPEEWHYWLTLPVVLGADPLVLPVAPGTDVDDMAARLDAEWQAAWEAFVAAALGPEPG